MVLMFAVLCILVLASAAAAWWYLAPIEHQVGEDERYRQGSSRSVGPSVQVLVLGDIGRSPRMQYHALSIARHGGQVQLIGYLETPPLPELQHHPCVTIISIPASARLLQTSSKILFLALAPIKVLLQCWNLWRVLAYETRQSAWLLVQNPPSIPTLLIAVIICRLRGTKLVVDWHNFGYSILALKLGNTHPLVKMSEWYEKQISKAAHYHFAVTDVMRSLLEKRFVGSAPVLTLHDRPAGIFRPLSDAERTAFMAQHPLLTDHFEAILSRKKRLVVSSTSWTPDEDFSVLLDALCRYSARATSTSPQLPELVVIITGKGPQRAFYEQKIAQLTESGDLEMVRVSTTWLSFEDYAALLASADLGVSLHTSSSGVDLPMKVVDMFGTGLPVLGYDKFEAWPELVQEGINGRGFSTAQAMADILEDLFEPRHQELEILRQGALRESKRRWDDEWNPVAGKLFGLKA